MRRLRRLGVGGVVLLAGFGAVHLVDTAYGAVRGLRRPARTPAPMVHLTAAQQPLVSALTRVLDEDGVPEAERWAAAIVRAAPTADLGYMALVTAQIRRESKFLVPDLEWLFRQLVPELVHELGVPDPVHTIGPMQVQRWRLQQVFERARGERLDAREVEAMACDLETGVAACVAVLDPIVVDYLPDRRVRGWVDSIGPAGLLPDAVTTARDFTGGVSAERRHLALQQKLLSDLCATPLALDGIAGDSTQALLHRCAPADLATLLPTWQQRFACIAPDGIAPRIAHDPRLAFVFADFNAGPGCCRTAALQVLMNDLLGCQLRCDGKRGPLTRAAMRRLFELHVDDTDRRADYLALLDQDRKPQWVGAQALALAQQLWRARHGEAAPDALVPDLWFGGAAQQCKGIGRISVEGYVAGSVAFFEDYLRRLVLYTGGDSPQPQLLPRRAE